MQNFKGTSSPIGADCQFVSRDKSLFPYRPMRHRLPDTRKKKKKMKKLKKKEKRTGRKKTRKNSRKANGTLIRVIANPVASGRSRLNGGHDISIRKQWKRFTAFFAGAYTRVPRGYARKTVIPEWAGGDDGDRGWEEGSRNGCKRIGSRNKRCSSVSWQNRPARSFLLAFYRADGPFPPFPWLFTFRWPVVVRKNSYAPFLFILIDIISGDMFMMFYIYIYTGIMICGDEDESRNVTVWNVFCELFVVRKDNFYMKVARNKDICRTNVLFFLWMKSICEQYWYAIKESWWMLKNE